MRIQRLFLLFALILVSACGSPHPSPTLPPTIAAPSTPTESPTFTTSPTQTSVPVTSISTFVTISDFEASNTAWKAGIAPEYTDSSSLSVALTSEHVSQGKQALQLNFEQNDLPKAIFYLDQSIDLSPASVLKFDIYNPGTISGVGIALTTGADLVWYESNSFSVENDKLVSISFDLTASTYKAASTNWEFWATLADLNNVSRLAIIIYPAESGTVFVDNIQFGKAP